MPYLKARLQWETQSDVFKFPAYIIISRLQRRKIQGVGRIKKAYSLFFFLGFYPHTVPTFPLEILFLPFLTFRGDIDNSTAIAFAKIQTIASARPSW
jgi:hypothetical protein